MLYRFEGFLLDEAACQLNGPDGEILLERRVFDLLVYLVRNFGRVVTKAELFRAIWSNRVVSEASLSVAVAAARRALGDEAAAPKFIATHHGRGYRFCAQVTELGLSASSAAPREVSPAEVFVGRDTEITSLQTALGASRNGRLQMVLIGGEPGIGKTRLVDSFATRATGLGNAVLVGRSPEEPGATAFWPWVQILRQHFAGSSPGGVGAALSGVEDIVHILPELQGMLRSPIPPALGDPLQARFRLFDSIATCLNRAARTTHLVVVLDDIHRADEASLLLLSFLTTALSESPVLVVATYRNTVRTPLFTRSVSTLSRSECVTTLHLEGLDAHDSAQLLERLTARSHNRPLVDALQERTRGNPFFRSQLAPFFARGKHELLGSLPQDLVATLAAQVEDLPPESRELLTTAAVIGSEFSLTLLAAALDASHDSLLPLLESATDSSILIRDSRPAHFRFRHALVRDALYQRLGTARRAILHQRIAHTLHHTLGGNAGPHLSTIAHHFYEAAATGVIEQAVDYSVLAGDWSSHCLAYEDAASHYGRAIELLDLLTQPNEELRCALLIKQGDHLTKAGARDAARSPFDTASRLANRLGASRFLADAALSASPGLLALESGVVDGFVIELVEGALSSLGQSHPELRAKLLARLSLALHWSDDADMARKLAEESLSLATNSKDSDVLASARQAVWSALHGPAFLPERTAIASDLIRSSTPSISAETRLVSHLFWLYSLLERGELSAFDRSLVEFRAIAAQIRQPQGLWYTAMLEGMRALLRGDFDKGAELAQEFAALGRSAHDANAVHSALAHAALICFERGEIGAMIPATVSMVRQYPSVIVWRAALAWMLALDGRHKEAAEELQAIGAERLASIPRRMDWSGTLALLGEAAAIIGDREMARVLYDQLRPLRNALVIHGLCTICWGAAARVLGLLSECLGDLQSAESELLDAIELNRRIGARPWVAHSQFALARVSIAMATEADAVGRATSLLGEARATAIDLGMTNLQNAATRIEADLGRRSA